MSKQTRRERKGVKKKNSCCYSKFIHCDISVMDIGDFIERSKVSDIIQDSINYLESNGNNGQKIEEWTFGIFLKVRADLCNNGYVLVNGEKISFWQVRSLCRKYLPNESVPTLQGIKEIPLWNELTSDEQQRLTNYFEEKPLFLKRRINDLYKRIDSVG